jgi:hypothetical protein
MSAVMVIAITQAETDVTSGSMLSWMYRNMRTGSVSVPGAARKTVMVRSSKDWMKASAQPLMTPGRINGSVTRRNSVQPPAPSETAAISTERSMPVAAANVRRSANGNTMMTCAMISAAKLPPRPADVKKRRKAMPSTTCGIISGERKRAARASRPLKR